MGLLPKITYSSTAEVTQFGFDRWIVDVTNQAIDLQYAIPLGIMRATLNLGISARLTIPFDSVLSILRGISSTPKLVCFTALANVTFDPPSKCLESHGVVGRGFVHFESARQLEDGDLRSFNLVDLLNYFQLSWGLGAIIPVNNRKVEVNFPFYRKRSGIRNGGSVLQIVLVPKK